MLNLIIILVMSITVTCINASAIFTASAPSILQTLASIVFLVFWLLFSMYKGMLREQQFLKLTTCYWTIGLVASFAAVVPFLQFISIASVFFFSGPSYGVLTMYMSPFFDATRIFVSTMLPLVISLIGYAIGRQIPQEKQNVNVEQSR